MPSPECYLLYSDNEQHFVLSFFTYIMLLRFSHVGPCIKQSLFFIWIVFHCVDIQKLVYPFTTWWTLSLLPILTIMNKVAKRIHIQAKLFFRGAVSFCIPTSKVWELWLLYIIIYISHFLFFDWSLQSVYHSEIVISLCGFNLPFPNDYWYGELFHILICISS